MKKGIAILGILLLLLTSLATATTTESLTGSVTDEVGIHALTYSDCGAGGASVDWTTIAWSDDSVNTTSCVDEAFCTTSSDSSAFTAANSSSVTTGTSVALEGQYIQCYWNLTNTTSSACNVSGFTAVCGGYNADYGATDSASVIIDGAVKFGVVIVSFMTVIGLFFLFRWIKKNR